MLDFGLYVITTEVPRLKRDHLSVAREALEEGANLVQLRDKAMAKEELLQVALSLRKLTRQASAVFIVNDYLDIAAEARADGVHIGQEDRSLSDARRVLGEGAIIGVSVRTVEEALEAQVGGADYLGVGPIFETPSKGDAGKPLGCAILKEIKQRVDLPIVAIGGISLQNLSEVIQAGADGIAVISAIALASDMRVATKRLVVKITEELAARNASITQERNLPQGIHLPWGGRN